MASTTTTDHDEIRNWAEGKDGKPAAVDRTHHDGDVGIIRIMFPDAPNSEHGSLVEISWDEFFDEFEQRQLALVYDENSLFSKIIGRDTAERREHGDHAASRHSDSKHDTGHGGANGQGHDAKAGHGGGQSGRNSDDKALGEREYRDADGNVHHHTRAYMEQHGKG